MLIVRQDNSRDHPALRGAGTPQSSGTRRFLRGKTHCSTLSSSRKKPVFSTPFITCSDFPYFFLPHSSAFTPTHKHSLPLTMHPPPIPPFLFINFVHLGKTFSSPSSSRVLGSGLGFKFDLRPFPVCHHLSLSPFCQFVLSNKKSARNLYFIIFLLACGSTVFRPSVVRCQQTLLTSK